MRRIRPAVVITCEHATCFVPKQFQQLFIGQEQILRSHRGWDPGTLDLGNFISTQFGCRLFATEVSRLLVEVNRSTWHSQLFSEYSRVLDDQTKLKLLNQYYHDYRNAIEAWIVSQSATGSRVLHLSLHSFTPILNGIERNADVGLLYDPRRPSERDFCSRWKACFRKLIPDWRIRKNYPYLGRSDGFTTFLRKRFSDDQYCGIELEINQRTILEAPKSYKIRMSEISETIYEMVGS